MAAKRCGVCGSPAPATAAFCRRCGGGLAADALPAAARSRTAATADTGWPAVVGRILAFVPVWTWPFERLVQSLIWRGRPPSTAGIVLGSMIGAFVTSYLVVWLIQWSAGWVITIPGGPKLEFYRYYAIPYLATGGAIGLNYLGPVANVLAFLVSSKVSYATAKRGARMWAQA